MSTYSTCIKQSSANQLVFPLSVDPSEYDFLTFGFYQNSRCIAMYNSYDTEYVDLSNEGEVRIYMRAGVAKRFNSSRVSYEVAAWEDSTAEPIVGCSFTIDVVKSHDQNSVVDDDDSEITNNRLRAQIERAIEAHGDLVISGALAVDENGYLYIEQSDSTEESSG